MSSPVVEPSFRTYARAAGVLYLIIIVCAGFAEGVVRSGIIVPGDAAATAENIVTSEGLFRFGLVCDLIAFISDAAVAVLLYMLLRPVSKTLSLIAASLRLLAHPAIASVNLLAFLGPVLLIDGSGYLGVFDGAQLEALSLLLLDVHHYGYLIGGAFFGVHCALFGYLLFKSKLFPSTLGVLIAAASVGYLTESFGGFLFPAYESVFAWIVVVPASVAEMSLCLWLLIKGVRVPRAS